MGEMNHKGSSSRAGKTEEKISVLVDRLPILGEIFNITEKIGEGTFSSVYLAKVKPHLSATGDEAHYAIKHLIPTCHPSRVLRELKCMHQIGGVNNVAGLTMCLRNNDCIVFVMPYQRHDRFNTYYGDLTVAETRLYLQQLLIALKRVHQFGVIHRDIKPSNFLFNRVEKRFLLVDFGLAQKVGELNTENGVESTSGNTKKRKRVDDDENDQVDRVKRQALQSLDSNIPMPPSSQTFATKRPVHLSTKTEYVTPSTIASSENVFAKPGEPVTSSMPCPCDGRPQVCHGCLVRKGTQSPRAGTPGFRPPEVLLKYPHQTTAVDMWAVGVMMMCILSRTYPFFKSPDDVTALAELITVFGSEEIKALATKLRRRVVCSEVRPAVDLRAVCERLASRKYIRSERFPPEAFNLLNRFLTLDPAERITAEEALTHPFLNVES